MFNISTRSIIQSDLHNPVINSKNQKASLTHRHSTSPVEIINTAYGVSKIHPIKEALGRSTGSSTHTLE